MTSRVESDLLPNHGGTADRSYRPCRRPVGLTVRLGGVVFFPCAMPVEKRLTRHARDQMERRGISEEAIDYVLEHYDTRVPAGPRPGSDPATIYTGKWDGRPLRVYVESGSSPPRVKTVAWEG